MSDAAGADDRDGGMVRVEGRAVSASIGRVMASALGAVVVLAGAGWLAAVGAGLLAWLSGLVAAFALGLLLTGVWDGNRTVAWLVALVFGATVVYPAVAVGCDVVLATRGQRVHATVTGYRHVSGVHSGSTRTRLRTPDGRYLEVSRYIDPTPHQPVTLLVDPAGTVAPQLASDVTVGSDLGWSLTGLVVVLAAIVGFGISGERDRLRRSATV